MNTIKCQVCQKNFTMDEVMKAELLEEPIVKMIREKYPEWSSEGFICLADLYLFRAHYVAEILKTSSQEIYCLEKEMVKEEQPVSRNLNREFESSLTLGERLSDGLANFGGSWTFIGIFMAMMVIWMGINGFALLEKPFDPFPYILLNLVLSCLAAIQAPVIMMSQNRQEAKDRLRAEHDYEINLKAEIEIRKLHERMDHLLMHQWQHLMDIQQLQVHMMEEINQHSTKNQ
ncbi:MAG: DUF1003 domain-containing protein [Thermodesulfobacteriota bacterium]